jgi:peptidoglycan/xylan/chitin deacetylase (PgdA/CDA1 family)
MGKINHLGSGALRLATRLWSTAGPRNRLVILIYHRILPKPDTLRGFETDAATFDWHMELVSKYFTPLSLQEALERRRTRSLPPCAICVTFDDGYADNFDVALPILKRWKVPAAFFVTTACLQGGMLWNDWVIEAVRHLPGDEVDLREMGLGRYSLATPPQRAASAYSILLGTRRLPPEERWSRVKNLIERARGVPAIDLMMNERQIRELHRAGMEVGGHTVSHPILTLVGRQEAWREISENKEQLEGIVGERLKSFAYPNGCPGKDYDATHMEMVQKAGYISAMSTAWGAVTQTTDAYQLPRLTPWDNTAVKFGARLLTSYLSSADLLPSRPTAEVM